MIVDELTKTEGLMELFTEVEVQRIRYPAIDSFFFVNGCWKLPARPKRRRCGIKR